jgi:hypothetical protein
MPSNPNRTVLPIGTEYVELERSLSRGEDAHANLIIGRDLEIKNLKVRLLGVEKTNVANVEIQKIEQKIEINSTDFDGKDHENGNNNVDKSSPRRIPFKIRIPQDIKRSCQGRFFSFEWKMEFILNRPFRKDIHLEKFVEIF